MRPRPSAALTLGALAVAASSCTSRPLLDDTDAVAVGGRDAGADTPPAPGAVDWGIAVGAPSGTGGSTTVTALAPLADGGAIVAGGFTGTVSFAADVTLGASSPEGGYVARFRSDQRLVWVTVLAAPGGSVTVSDLASLPDGEIAIAGWFGGTLTLSGPEGTAATGASLSLDSAGGLDAFVARLASDGSLRWAKRAGGPDDDIARGIAARVDPSGAETIALTGAVGVGAVLGAGEPAELEVPSGDGPIFVATLDGDDGSLVWAAFPGGQIPSQGYAVAIDGSGAVGITGYVNGPAPFGTDPNGMAVTIDPANGRAFVAAWTASGALAYADALGGPMGEGDAIVDAVGGGFVAAGLFEGTVAFAGLPSVTLSSDEIGAPACFVAALDGSGAAIWARRLAGSGLRVWRARRDDAGDLFLATSFGGHVLVDPDGPHPASIASAGDDDAAFVRLAPSGTLQAVTTGGGLGDDEGLDFAPAGDGTSWAGGTYAGPASFGAQTVTLDSGTAGGGFLLHLDR